MRSTVCIAAGLLIAMVVSVVFVVFQVDRYDAEDYRALIASSSPQSMGEIPGGFSARQQRQGVVKSIVYSNDDSRLQLRMRAAESELVLTSEGEGLEVVEYMKGVECDLQEELYYLLQDGRQATMQKNGRLLLRKGEQSDVSSWIDLSAQPSTPMQTVRHFDAESATYYYNRDFIEADQVNLARFNAEGHGLAEELVPATHSLQGVADSVEMKVGGSQLQFRANRLKAQIMDGGKLL